MNWLNKIDNVLDSVLLPKSNNEEEEYDVPIDEIYDDNIDEITDLRTTYTNEQIPSNSSLTNGVEDQNQPVNYSLHAMGRARIRGALPNPGMIRPVLRDVLSDEDDSDGESSFVDTDDEQNLDYKANASNVIQSTDILSRHPIETVDQEISTEDVENDPVSPIKSPPMIFKPILTPNKVPLPSLIRESSSLSSTNISKKPAPPKHVFSRELPAPVQKVTHNNDDQQEGQGDNVDVECKEPKASLVSDDPIQSNIEEVPKKRMPPPPPPLSANSTPSRSKTKIPNKISSPPPPPPPKPTLTSSKEHQTEKKDETTDKRESDNYTKTESIITQQSSNFQDDITDNDMNIEEEIPMNALPSTPLNDLVMGGDTLGEEESEKIQSFSRQNMTKSESMVTQGSSVQDTISESDLGAQQIYSKNNIVEGSNSKMTSTALKEDDMEIDEEADTLYHSDTMDALLPVKSLDMSRGTSVDTFGSIQQIESIEHEDTIESKKGSSPSPKVSLLSGGFFNGILPRSKSINDDANRETEESRDKRNHEDRMQQGGNTSANMDTTIDSNVNTTMDSNDSEQQQYHAMEMQATFGDFLPSSTYDDREDSSHHTSMTELEGSEYIVSGSTEWKHNESIDDLDPDYVPPFHNSMNCHGVVHVRVLRAQHLPCSVDSSLQVIYSLQPWNGRIRSERASSYKGPSEAGICARWDRPKNGKDNKVSIDNDDTNGTVSMVHAYNSEETPVPNILIQLKESALMFEREVCSMLLSCKPLMSQSGVFHRRWCTVDEKKAKNNSTEDRQKGTKPTLFLVEACFEPSHNGEDSSNEHQPTVTLDVPSPEVEDKKETRNRCDTHGSDVSVSQHSVRTKVTSVGTMKRLTSKPHLFRNYTSLRPTYCAICNTMIAWKLKGYQCEVCRIDCCTDCQLRIDVELPCGSEKAKEAVKKSFEGKLSLAKIYEVVAPKKLSEEDQESKQDAGKSSKHSDKDEWKDGVGTFTIRIKSACIFRSHFPPETDLRQILEVNGRLRSGDYYARVSWTDSKKTRRTKAVFQSAKPIFDSDDIVVTSLHYGTEFKIEVIDASTDLCIGSKLLTTQGLLQWQRDNIGWGLSFSSLLNEEPLQLKRRPARFELRDNVKTGFGLDFYNASKISETERAGEISGWIDVDLSFEENKDLYSLSHPKPCPVRPVDDFNVELIQLHVARMTAIFEDFQNFAESYNYVVSWKNPALTSLSLLLFVSLTIKFNAEYSGCLPFAFLIIYMVYSGHTRRKHGGFKVRLLKKETEEKVKELKGTSINYQKHRPVAQLEISIPKGRTLIPNYGIPGSIVANVVWDGLKFANESTKTSITAYDPTSSAIYPIGETEGSGVTSSPEWGVILPSNELERMKQLLPSQNFLSRTHSGSLLSESEFLEEQNKLNRKTLTFPVLQPIALGTTNSSVDDEDLEEDDSYNDVRVLPWKESKGALVVQVRFADVLNKLTMFDQVLGDVVIPFSKIAADGKVEGWFQVLEKGTLRTVEEPELMENEDEISTNEKTDGTEDENDPEASEVRPAIYLRAVVKFPNSRLANDIDKETSVVVAEQLIRISKAKKENGLGFLGTSINTFNTVTGVRGNIQNIQNQLGDALDKIEMIKNLFNFTCPEKSGLILICIIILWYILCIIPTRVLILVGGLAQYGVTFKAEFYSNIPIQSTDADAVEQNDEYDPILTRLMNFLSGIPTDEDLRRYYFWEAIQVGEREREVLAQTKRSTRLTKLWKAQWFGKVQLKVQNTFASESGRRWDWKSIFCIIQGHRFVWWNSEKDFDDGENPSGQIFFAGHSGLAGLSPLEMRELKPTEVPLVISIFGRGSTISGQQTKVTLLTQDTKFKDSLELAVLHASMDVKKD